MSIVLQYVMVGGTMMRRQLCKGGEVGVGGGGALQ